MEVIKTIDKAIPRDERRYIAAITLGEFRGHKDLELQLFRPGGGPEEMEALKDKQLVGAPDPAMPRELVAQATEDMALQCLLEAFTAEEAELLVDYLQNRYGEQITELNICPMPLPLPLGVGPLARVPETASSGFINFDLAPDYPLPFPFKGFYQL